MADAYEEVVRGTLKLKGVSEGGVKKFVVKSFTIYIVITVKVYLAGAMTRNVRIVTIVDL